MPNKTRVVGPGKADRQVVDPDDGVLAVPKGWTLLPPGDAGLTRRVKAAGPSWTVKQKRGRRVFSLGVWADGKTIAREKRRLEEERSTEQYAKRQRQAAARRDKKQSEYVDEFESEVLAFLNFDHAHEDVARRLAKSVTEHAPPVGSGTVARTQRISIRRRAESAVIAWMRHQTTAYDDLVIPRQKGRRREVRRTLAAQSRKLLGVYRSGGQVDTQKCPLHRALFESVD